MSEYKLKPGKIGEAAVSAYKNIEEKFVETFLEKDESQPSGYTLKTGDIAEKAAAAYKKIENSAVGAYKKIEDAFVDTFLEKVDGDDKSKEG